MTARPTCAWRFDDHDCAYWQTDCGQQFVLNDGTPTQNQMRFCCYCGGALTEVHAPTTPTTEAAMTDPTTDRAAQTYPCPDCKGKGWRATPCPYCHDSTWDHECPDATPCATCGRTGRMADRRAPALVVPPDRAALVGRLKESADRADQCVSDINDGKKRWTLSVPARVDDDADLIFSALSRVARAAAAALAAPPIPPSVAKAREALDRVAIDDTLYTLAEYTALLDRYAAAVRAETVAAAVRAVRAGPLVQAAFDDDVTDGVKSAINTIRALADAPPANDVTDDVRKAAERVQKARIAWPDSQVLTVEEMSLGNRGSVTVGDLRTLAAYVLGRP